MWCLELFVKEQDHLITCDAEESNRNIRLFQALFSARVTSSFNEIVTYRSQKCVTQSANSAANRAKNAAQSPEQISAAADVARYTAAAQQSPLLAAATVSGPTPYRVVIHINSEADRAAAVALQGALVQKGFSAPGIELVSSAPNSYQVRYYYAGQLNDAKNVAVLATSQLGLTAGSIQIPAALENTYKALPKNTMEFWFPRRSNEAS